MVLLMYRSVLSQHFEKVPAFVAVARLGSLSKAAQALAISQAALSQSMKKLEDILEVTLFIRSRTGIKLTPEGKILYKQARKITEDIGLLEALVRKGDDTELKRVQIGTHEALAIHFWPSVIESFQKKYSSYALSIMSGRVDEIVQQISNGDLDLALTVRPKGLSGVKTQTLYEDELEFFIAKKHKPVKQKLSREEISKIPILTDNQAHLEQGKSVIQALGEMGLFSSNHFALNSFEAAARLAEKGAGIAFLPRRIAGDLQSRFHLRKISFTEVPKGVFRHQICLSYRQDRHSIQRTSQIITFLEKTVR